MPSTSTVSITITLLSSYSAGPFTIPIPQDSSSPGSGFNASQYIRDIFKAGGFFEATGTTFYPASAIQSITAS